jgi:ribosome biogenesis GTPase
VPDLNPGREALGWNAWFAEQARLHCSPADTAARVTSVDRGWLVLLNETGVFRAQLSGNLLHSARAAAARPCVGDWVCVARAGADGFGSVQALLERQTSLRRKAVGNAAVEQMIAANVDCVIIVQSCHFDFNLPRLERYLVMVRDGGIDPVVLLTKTDLVSPQELQGLIERIRGIGVEAPIVCLSNVTGAGVDEVRQRMVPGKTYCLLGSSGVGKTTLINRLLGGDALATGEVSHTGEGRHTTTRRHLIVLPHGAMLIDMPGMRELGLLGAGEGIADTFADIHALATQCRYPDCTHGGEPGCGVRAAIERGEISEAHLRNYQKLRKESEFHDLSQQERRKKDRAFGRFLHAYKKQRD